MPPSHPAHHRLPVLPMPLARRTAALLLCASLATGAAGTAQAQWGPVETPPQPWVVMGFIASLPRVRLADFGDERPSSQTRRVADLVVATRDHKGRPFFIVDQVQPRLYAFNAAGRLLGASSILVSGSPGDDAGNVAGLRAITAPKAAGRGMPAGRFAAQGAGGNGADSVLWAEQDKTIAMFRARNGKQAGHMSRLDAPRARDPRVAWGSINVPAAFYDTYVEGAVRARRANIYVIPEARPLAEVFHWPGQPTPARPTPAVATPPVMLATR